MWTLRPRSPVVLGALARMLLLGALPVHFGGTGRRASLFPLVIGRLPDVFVGG
jgi:hypothetical protein